MGDTICRKCGKINGPIKNRKTDESRALSKIENKIIKTVRIIDEDTVCALCGGKIDWFMS